MRRHIALISEHASPLSTLGGVDAGGQNVYVAQVAKQLAELGHAVDVFTRRDDARLPQLVTCQPGYRVIHVDAGPLVEIPKEDLLPYMGAFARQVLEFAARSRPYDVCHANFFLSGLVGMALARRHGTPLVTTFHALGRVRRMHQSQADRFPEERVDIEQQLVAGSDRIIAECPQDRDDQVQLYGADPRRIRIIPCGFDPTEMWPIQKHRARQILGLDASAPLILHLGRMVPRKGIDTIIQAVARLKDQGVTATLLVVGGATSEPDPRATPEIGRLHRLAQGLGVADCVAFAGRRDRHQLKYYYGAADVFVTTPWYEPFGITPVEAMACGTPVVGSAVGGIKYTVVDGQSGYVVPPRDPAALAERLATLLANPQLRRMMGQQGLWRANEFFTWPLIARRIAEVYEEAIAEKLRARLDPELRAAKELAP